MSAHLIRVARTAVPVASHGRAMSRHTHPHQPKILQSALPPVPIREDVCCGVCGL